MTPKGKKPARLVARPPARRAARQARAKRPATPAGKAAPAWRPAGADTARVRRTVEALIRAAADGKPDAAWIAEAIQKAGYLKREGRITREEARNLVVTVRRILEELAPECGETCGTTITEKIVAAMDRLAKETNDAAPTTPGEPGQP